MKCKEVNMAFNIFKQIKYLANKQITNNFGNAKFNQDGLAWDSIKTRFYPQAQVMWLVKNNIAVLDSVKTDNDEKGKFYVIKFKEFNLDNPFFEREKKRTLPVSQLMAWNDEHRQEDERTYSQSRVDDDYYYQDETRYEKLALEDNCTFEMFIQSLGYNSYRDFLLQHENDTKEFREIIDEEYKEFLNEISTKEYEV